MKDNPISTYIGSRKYSSGKTKLVIKNNSLKKTEDKLFGWVVWSSLIGIILLFILIFSWVNTVHGTQWVGMLDIILLILLIIIAIIWGSYLIVSHWNSTTLILRPHQIQIKRLNLFQTKKIKESDLSSTNSYINYVLSDKEQLLGMSSGVSYTDVPIEYEYKKGVEPELQLIIQVPDTKGLLTDIVIYRLPYRLISNEKQQLDELKQILVDIKTALEKPGIDTEKLLSKSKLTTEQQDGNHVTFNQIATTSAICNKGPFEFSVIVNIKKIRLVTPIENLVAGYPARFVMEVSQSKTEDSENWHQEFVYLTYEIDAVDKKKQQLRLLLPKNSKIKNEDSTLSYSFQRDVPFLVEDSFAYWDLTREHFRY